MDIRQLDQEFHRGTIKHYTLAEYQFLRRFCELTQPGTITVVGGHTNLDLFYATQECSPRVTNWDPGAAPEATHRASHDRFREITRFRGEYQWLPQSVADFTAIDMAADLVWLNVIPGDIMGRTQWPESLVFAHNGDLTQVATVLGISRHIPMVALGEKIVVYSRQEHDWNHHTYRLKRDRNLGPISPVTEIVR